MGEDASLIALQLWFLQLFSQSALFQSLFFCTVISEARLARSHSIDQDIDPSVSLALPLSADADTDSSALPLSADADTDCSALLLLVDPDEAPSVTSDVPHTCDRFTEEENKGNVPPAANSTGASLQSAPDKLLLSASESLSDTRKVFSYVTEFLTFSEVALKPSKSTKKPGGARILTSDESLR